MAFWRVFQQIEMFLRGWPNSALTVALAAGGAIILYIAFFAPPAVKGIALAYILIP